MKARATEKTKMRSGIAVAMRMRYGKTTGPMKDRRAPRGGARNEQTDLLDQAHYERDVTEEDDDDGNPQEDVPEKLGQGTGDDEV